MSASHGSGAAASDLDPRIVTHHQLEQLAARLEQYAARHSATVQRLAEVVTNQTALTAGRFSSGGDKLQEAMSKLAGAID